MFGSILAVLWFNIGEQAIVRSNNFSDQGIANLLWSYSKNQIVPQDRVLDGLSQRAKVLCPSLDGLKFVALFHSFAVVGHPFESASLSIYIYVCMSHVEVADIRREKKRVGINAVTYGKLS